MTTTTHPRGPVTRNGLTMMLRETFPAVGLYLDFQQPDSYRLHTGAEARGFRGYALQDERFKTWNVAAWCTVTGRKFERRNYRTERGALAALERCAAWIEG